MTSSVIEQTETEEIMKHKEQCEAKIEHEYRKMIRQQTAKISTMKVKYQAAIIKVFVYVVSLLLFNYI